MVSYSLHVLLFDQDELCILNSNDQDNLQETILSLAKIMAF